MGERGKGLLIIAGMKPKGGAAARGSAPAGGDGDDDAGPESESPPSANDYAPDEATNKAGAEALEAAQKGDAEGYTRALCALIDAHTASKG